MDPRSALYGISGLQSGDIIKGINECSISSLKDWHSCLRAQKSGLARGYCITNAELMSSIASKVVNLLYMNYCNHIYYL